MRQTALMVAAFAATFGLLGIGFFALQSIQGSPPATASAAPTSPPTAGPTPTRRPSPSPAATPSPVPPVTPSPTAVAVASDAAPTAAPSPSPVATPSPSPPAIPSTGLPTQSSPATPVPTATPPNELVVTLRGDQYKSATVIEAARLTVGADGSLTIETDRSTDDAPLISYEVPPDRLLFAGLIRSIDVRVCGSGTGDFWETYGPVGGEPFEYEGTAPAPDGCWHFTGAPGPDTTVIVSQRHRTTQTIVLVEYTIRFAF